MDATGGYVERHDDPFDTARRLVTVVRECIALKLAGLPLL
jgi:hypothetical protein